MATCVWRGGALGPAGVAVAQVSTLTPANVEIGDTFTATITSLDDGETTTVAFVATAATVANVTAGLVAAWAKNPHPLAQAIAATDSTTYVTLTARIAGSPFSVSGAATNVGGGADTQTLTAATTTASIGPSDAKLAANWVGNALPTGTDAVTFPAGAVYDCLYNLDYSATTFAAVTVEAGCSINVGRNGIPVTTGLTITGRMYAFKCGCTGLTIRGSGSFLRFDVGSSAISPVIEATGTAAYAGIPAVTVNGSALATVIMTATCTTTVGIAPYPGDTATVTGGWQVSGGTLTIGSGTTVSGTTCTVENAATVYAWASVPTVVTRDEAEYYQRSGNWTTGTAHGESTLVADATGTYATTTIHTGATLDLTNSLRARTFTALTVHAGAYKLLPDDPTVITITTETAPSGISKVLLTK